MSEDRESIKDRLHKEAARQWGVDEIDLKNGSFDPLVDLLFGAFATETEKVWHEIESARAHTVRRMVSTILPETVTGIIPAHTVMLARPAAGPAETAPSDQFVTPGNNGITMSPAGAFPLSGATVKIIASGTRIDKIGVTFQRESIHRLPAGNGFAPHVCWVGIELPERAVPETLTLFFNWNAVNDQVRYLPYVPLIRFFNGSKKTFNNNPFRYEHEEGIISNEHHTGAASFFKSFEESVRDYYKSHFSTITNLNAQSDQTNLPEEWAGLVSEANAKALFPVPLLWLKLTCPASIPADALDRMDITTNCIPVLNRKLIHQRGRLQPLFNVYGLKDEEGFLAIERVIDGDGAALKPVGSDQLAGGQNVYMLRNHHVARFDQRDAFDILKLVTVKMRDDLAAFNAMDNSIITGQLDKINQGVAKLRDHLATVDYQLPQIYILVKTRSAGTILDVHFWTSVGARGNGLRALTKLTPDSSNRFKTESALLMLPSTGGRDQIDEAQMQKAFKEAILTRGRAVTVEDYKAIAATSLGKTALKVEVKKRFGIGEGPREGLRAALELTILPDPNVDQSEEYWLMQARHVKNLLLQKSAGLIPLYVFVEGFKWKL